jgi:hypothetical protein
VSRLATCDPLAGSRTPTCQRGARQYSSIRSSRHAQAIRDLPRKAAAGEITGTASASARPSRICAAQRCWERVQTEPNGRGDNFVGRVPALLPTIAHLRAGRLVARSPTAMFRHARGTRRAPGLAASPAVSVAAWIRYPSVRAFGTEHGERPRLQFVYGYFTRTTERLEFDKEALTRPSTRTSASSMIPTGHTSRLPTFGTSSPMTQSSISETGSASGTAHSTRSTSGWAGRGGISST